jgi:hypothetical protein
LVRLKDLKPASGETRGVILGVLLSLLLHLVAFIAIVAVGSAIDRNEGALFALSFLVSIGLSQWIYIGPFAWLLRRRRTGIAKGLVISGGLVTFASTLCYGGMGLMSLQNASETRRIQQEERDHPRDYISAKGVVTSVDDSHFEFRHDDGSVVSLRTFEGLDYVLLKKDGGYENRTRDILKPGVRVSVEYSQDRGKPPDSASIVRVYEEGAP